MDGWMHPWVEGWTDGSINTMLICIAQMNACFCILEGLHFELH